MEASEDYVKALMRLFKMRNWLWKSYLSHS
jgi:hypothetical protein